MEALFGATYIFDPIDIQDPDIDQDIDTSICMEFQFLFEPKHEAAIPFQTYHIKPEPIER
jgi:hypothetical protein